MIRLHQVSIFLFFFLAVYSSYGQSYTISGYVSDAASGERLVGASIVDTSYQQGIASNTYGFFSLTLPAGQVALRASYLGYQPKHSAFTLTRDTTLSWALEAQDKVLSEVAITDQRERLADAQMSTFTIRPVDIARVPMFMSEPDLMKAIQLLPGIQSGTEGTTSLHVRGGGPDQNLILLDGVPVYNVSHLLGFVSTFNTHAIQKVEVVKGGFPARYGGRLSSVVDIQLKEGNTQKLSGVVNVGLIASQLQLEGPWGNKTSFLISGRRTWLDLFTTIPKLLSGSGTTYHFYDLTGKINHQFSKRDRLLLSAYSSGDGFGSSLDRDNSYTMRWGNLTTALRWNHIINTKWFTNLTATYSQYRFNVNTKSSVIQEDSIALETESQYLSQIQDIGLNVDVDFFPNPRHAFKTGMHMIYHAFKPSVARFQAVGSDIVSESVAINDNVLPALEGYLYLEDEIKFSTRWRANAGLHGSSFWTEDTAYYSLQPRVSLSHLLNARSSLKASFVTMTQFLHLLSNTSVGIPTDIWVPSTNRIRPQRSWQAALGVTHQLAYKQIELSLETYYKRMDRLVQFTESSNFLSESLDTDFLHDAQRDWQETVAVGQGWAYGTEILIRKPLGKTTGWLGYTLSWSQRQFETLNRGEKFPYKYDRRHNLSLTLHHQFNSKISAGANWTYMSGYNITLPVASYQSHSFINYSRVTFENENFVPVDHYVSTNNYRTPAYHRLDLSVNFRKEKERGTRVWSIAVYNAYNRRNPFFLYPVTNGIETRDRSGERQLMQQSLFSIIPSVSYSYEF